MSFLFYDKDRRQRYHYSKNNCKRGWEWFSGLQWDSQRGTQRTRLFFKGVIIYCRHTIFVEIVTQFVYVCVCPHTHNVVLFMWIFFFHFLSPKFSWSNTNSLIRSDCMTYLIQWRKKLKPLTNLRSCQLRQEEQKKMRTMYYSLFVFFCFVLFFSFFV